MPSRRIDRDELILALKVHADSLANLDIFPFVNQFFKDESEWRGSANRVIKQVRTEEELENRNQALLARTLELKERLFVAQTDLETLKALQQASSIQIARLRSQIASMAPQPLPPELLGTQTA